LVLNLEPILDIFGPDISLYSQLFLLTKKIDHVAEVKEELRPVNTHNLALF